MSRIMRSQCRTCIHKKTNASIKSSRKFSTLNSEWRPIFDSQMNITTPHAWYEVDTRHLDEQANQILHEHFKGSLYRALCTIFPEVEWYPWRFKHQQRVPRNFWKDQSNQQKFFDDLGKQIRIKSLDDWYGKLSANIVLANGGTAILNMHNGSPTAAIMAIYPQHNWLPWKFEFVPSGYWKSKVNQRKYFDWLSELLAINTPNDWYEKLSAKIMQDTGARTLLDLYNGSPLSALQSIYPEHEWIIKRKPREPKQPKDDIEKIKSELKILLEKQKLTQSEWYQVSMDSIDPRATEIMDTYFQHSLYRALSATFPELSWDPWNFKSEQQRAPRGFWQDLSNQRKFFDYLGTKLGVSRPEDWYSKLSQRSIQENGGSGLITFYKGSPVDALMAVYPEHIWIPWKFKSVFSHVWQSQDNVKAFLAELSDNLSIRTLDDWYRVDQTQLRLQFHTKTLLNKYQGLYGLLKEQYPQHPWDQRRFQVSGKKGQRWLVVTLQKMFPDEEIMEDFMHPKVVLPSSNRSMQLDVFIPKKNLAFEYQGKQHYEELGVFSPTKQYQKRDEEKRILCAANNIKLIEVPYWWNRTQEELQDFMIKGSM